MPTVSPGRDGTARTAGDHSGHEGGPVQGVVPDGEGLAVGAEQDLLVGDQPAQPHPVDPDPVDLRAAGSGQLLNRGVRWFRQVRRGSGGRDPPSGGGGGPGRGVGLVGVVQLDDLRALVERRGLRREVHHQHRADGEVGRDQHPHARMAGQQRPELVQALVGEPGGADDGVDALLDAPGQVVQHGVRVGEVDDDRGGLGGLSVIAQVEGGDQLQPVGGLHGSAHLGPHPAPRAEHCDLDHRPPHRRLVRVSAGYSALRF